MYIPVLGELSEPQFLHLRNRATTESAEYGQGQRSEMQRGPVSFLYVCCVGTFLSSSSGFLEIGTHLLFLLNFLFMVLHKKSAQENRVIIIVLPQRVAMET